MDLAVIILAAGKGERMKSSFPKVFHNVCFRPMVHYPFKVSQKLKPKKTIVVIGKNGKEINKRLEGKYEVVFQKEPRGTGDAALKAEKATKGFEGNVLVLCGDAPLITESTLKDLMKHHIKKRADVTILTCDFDNPYGYGRIVRGEKGKILKVIEEKDASKKEKQIREINSGTYVFNKKKLFQNLKKIRPDNKQKEYYLTDIVELFCSKGLLVEAHKASSEKEVKGINTREELAEVEKIMRYRINKVFMEKGVTIIEPFLTFIDPEVKIGKDTIVLPMTYIEGNVKIGERCKIGPSTQILNSQVGNECEISCSLIKESKIFNKVNIGPFSHLRPGSLIKEDVKIGSFVEVKKSEVDKGSKVPHLSYIGDTEIGKNVNVGAGTITCNYDGIKKSKTIIKDNAFIGSNTMLIAPVSIGKGAVVGAGSVISEDVPEDALGIGRSKQKNIEGWVKKKKRK